MKTKHINLIIAIGLIVMAGSSRILNAEFKIYNLAPVAALGLFSGAIIKDKRLSYLMALLAYFISDLFFSLFTSTPGFYPEQAFVYAGIMAVTFLGTKMGQPKALKVLGYSLAGSLIFFIISNLGVWITIEFGKVDLYGYGKGFSGLVNTFAAAIPYYRPDTPTQIFATKLFVNSFAGDLVFSVLLFGSYYLLRRGVEAKLAITQ